MVWLVIAGAVAATPGDGSRVKALETPAQIMASALRQSVGAPARVDLGDQATLRLSEDLIFVPLDPSTKMLKILNRAFPADLTAVLIGSEGIESLGMIRYVPSGFVDANEALAWTKGDILSSLNDTVAMGNADRAKRNLPPLEARRWVLPPRYNPETHQISWAALILPQSAPRESDGEVTYHAIGFGRDGYVELTAVSSLQKADLIGHMMNGFLSGLNFRPGQAFGDARPTDRRASGGLAAALGIASLHKAPAGNSFLAEDRVVPVAGGAVAAIGALSLLIYVRRHMRREARRG